MISKIPTKYLVDLQGLHKRIVRTIMPETSVLPRKFSEGPHGLGDPEDRTLRKVEIEVLIPKVIRERARTEKCTKEVENFNKCCKDSSVLMVIKCRNENSALKSCLAKWYEDEQFKSICTETYLQRRSEYRRTGIKESIRRM